MHLAGIIERHARLSPTKLALHFEGQDIAYLQLWESSCHAADVLHANGVRVGDRVAWLGLNDPAMLVLLFALARLGAILLPLNYRLAAAEQVAILADAQASLLVTDAGHAPTASALTACLGGRLLRACELNSAAVAATVVPFSAAAAHDLQALPVLLVYTSGTSGRPKGALHSQAALVWNCIIASHAQEMQASDHVLTALPLFHVGGLCIQTLPALHAGACVTLHARFEPGRWLADVQARRPTLSVMVPATLRAVLEHPDSASTDIRSLRMLVAGSSVVPLSLIDAFHRRGLPVGQVYGATETGPVSICLQRADAMRVPGSAGRAALHVQVRLVDEAGGDVAQGEVGEIWINAPNLMLGYWQDPDHPSFVDSWFRSGDLAHQDGDGFFWVVGRLRDMIISGGENIYPAEIENLLLASPDIAEVAVVGQSDARWGEVVVAIVVRRPDSPLDEAAVLALLEGRLARYKLPRRVLFRTDLPKTALGKVQKAQLQEWVAAAS